MRARPALFQDFIRLDLGIGWIFAVALGIGLLAGSIGKFMQLPHEVYSFNRTLEKADLYEFFYDKYLQEAKYKSPDLMTREEAAKVEKLREVMRDSSPGFLVAMLMLVVGLIIVLLFTLRLGAAFHKRIRELEVALAGEPDQEDESSDKGEEFPDTPASGSGEAEAT